MSLYLAVNWTIDPEIISSPIAIRWYGLFFAIAFLVGHYMMSRMFKREGIPNEWLDSLLIYVMIGTVVGARLGHVFFYDLADYLKNPLDILKVWEGGLASHGAAIGIILMAWLYARRISKKPVLWGLDRIVVTVAFAGFMIRMGNLMNHEIVGIPTGTDFGFIFNYSYEDPVGVPRHPTQLYEAICYIFIFAALFFSYWKTNLGRRTGFLFGAFLTLIFGVRFFLEFVKVQQADDKVLDALPFGLGESLLMGQVLSVPLVLAGFWFMYRSFQVEIQPPYKAAPRPAPNKSVS
ncbi:MAG: prolipoprotein diacylglyceryl transferase [Salibacteraceae bacterium]